MLTRHSKIPVVFGVLQDEHPRESDSRGMLGLLAVAEIGLKPTNTPQEEHAASRYFADWDRPHFGEPTTETPVRSLLSQSLRGCGGLLHHRESNKRMLTTPRLSGGAVLLREDHEAFGGCASAALTLALASKRSCEKGVSFWLS